MTSELQFKQIEIRSDSTNKYPNVYLVYKAVDSTQTDKLKSIIDVKGCTALDVGVSNIYNDVEHQDYVGKVLRKNKYEASGGQVVEVWEENNALYAKSRVGQEHVIADSNGQIKGSTYASAWLAYAQNQVNTNGGNTRDYIPDHIHQEFFEGRVVFPIKSVSVEMKYDQYIDDNTTNLADVMTIRKWDLTRVSFLLFSTPGQTYSGIESIEIRSMKNLKDMENIKSIRCLCDLKELRNGDYLKNAKTNQLWSVRSENDKITITNIASSEVLETTLDELKANEDLDLATVEESMTQIAVEADVLESSDTTIPEVRSAIRACMACQANQKKLEEDSKKKVRADEAPVQSPEPVDNTTTDVEVLAERVNKLEEGMNSILSKLDSLTEQLTNNSTRSTEGGSPDVVIKPTPTEVPVDEPKPTLDDEISSSIRSFGEVIDIASVRKLKVVSNTTSLLRDIPRN